MATDIQVSQQSVDRLQKLRRLKELKDMRDNPKPRYNYVQPVDGQDEKIQFHDGKVVSAPPGTGQMFSQIENDDLFDSPSSSLEESAAMFEKQGAYLALIANAYGLVGDDEINDFVADRSRALADAQRRQPEYMKRFNQEFEDASGFFETAGVFFNNPRALGRSVITQAPNSALPILTTYLGAVGGAKGGALLGAPAGPKGVVVGSGVGAVGGGGAGAFTGGAMVEIGAEIDSMMQEAGVDVTDANSILDALSNDAFMDTIKAKAERKGITTAAVDALFQLVGGRFIKAAKIKGGGKLARVGAGVADVGVQSLGEGVGEAAGQFAKDGKVNFKEAALEAVTSIGQSVGQTAIGATVGQAQQLASQGIAFTDETVTSTGTQDNNRMSITKNGEVVGTLDYSESRGGIKINMIDVPKEARRQGYATELVKELQRNYPKTEIEWGFLTDDGKALQDSLDFIVEENQEYAQTQQRLDDINQELIAFAELTDNAKTEAQFEEVKSRGEYINQLYDEKAQLEVQLQRGTRERRIVNTEAVEAPADVDTSQIDTTKSYSRSEVALMDDVTRKTVMQAKLKEAKNEKHRQNIKNKYSNDANKFVEKSRKMTMRGKVADTAGDLRRLTGAAITPISTRLKNINPKLRAQLRKFEFGLMKQVNADRAVLEPFLQKWSKLDPEVRGAMDYAMKNGDQELITELAANYDMTQEVGAMRTMLDEVYARAESVGYDLGYQEGFFPRHVIDHEGLVNHFDNTEVGGLIREAIHKKELELGELLSIEEKAALINTLLRGYGNNQIQLSKPGALKERNIDRVTAEINQYYNTTDQALIRYVSTVNEAIEARKFFGKQDTTEIAEGEAGQTKDMNDSIGMYVMDLIQKGDISANQAKELSDILQARFNRGRMSQFWRVYKNLSYIDTMGSPTSALTQIGDLAFSMYKNGVYRTFKALPKAAMNKSEVNRHDIGVEKIAAEFEHGSTSAKAVDTVFKLVGLDKIDAIGKETLINSALDRFRKQAQKPSTEFIAELELLFEDETQSVLNDLRSGRTTENVKLLLLNELMNFQPIALSEMPEAYLRMGNGRLLYMLKTFTIKQFDIYRNEVFANIREGVATGNKKQTIQGMQNLTRLLFFFVMMNASADFLKDLLLGRETPPDDYIVNNILRTMGISKFQIYSARREGLGTAVGKTILPPFKFIDSLYKDIHKVKDGNLDPEDAKTLASIPVVGKLYYWWFGGGTEHGSKTGGKSKF